MDADELLWRYRGGKRDFTAVDVSIFSLVLRELTTLRIVSSIFRFNLLEAWQRSKIQS